MTTKKLHELIELAEKGIKFKARMRRKTYPFHSQDFFLNHLIAYKVEDVIADWEYIEHREPLKMEFECEWDERRSTGDIYPHPFKEKDNIVLEKLIGKRTKVIVEEIVE